MTLSIIEEAGAQPPRWSRAHMVARETVRELQRAEAALERAHQVTDDQVVAHRVERARKEVREALRRAGVVLKDVDLREAEQGVLGPGGAP